MRHIKAFLLVCACVCAQFACTRSEAPEPAPEPNRMGSGSIAATFTETVALASGTLYSTPIQVASTDTVGLTFRIASGTASCTESIEFSNDFTFGTDAPDADVKWGTTSTPAQPTVTAIAGGAQTFGVQLSPYPFKFERVKFVCASGSSSLTLTTQEKGG